MITMTERIYEEKELVGRRFIYNNNSKICVAVVLSIMIAVIFGLFQEAYYTELDNIYAIDFWSVSHFLTGFIVYAVLFYMLKNKNLAIIISMILFIGFEVYEQTVAYYYPSTRDLYQEVLSNSITDIILNTIGLLVGMLMFKRNNIK